MAKQERKGQYVQFGGIDQELAERFRSACRAVGSDAGAVLTEFMRDFLDRTIVKPPDDAKPSAKRHTARPRKAGGK